MGHIVSHAGVSPDPDKIDAVKGMIAPTDVTSLRRFLGVVGYLQKFVPNLS